jgi:hypothetical protein
MTKINRILILILLVSSTLHAQPAADMHIGSYKENATPYPIYAGLFGSSPVYDPAAIDVLGKNFDAYYGNFDIKSDVADAIRKLNPNFKFIKYQGAWQLNGASRVKVENQKDQVLHYRVGNLESKITATQTKFKISDLFGKIIASNSPNDKSVGYMENGFFKYITWLRIGDEVLKIMAVSGNEVEVIRGFDKTTSKEYAANTTVLSPVYGTAPTPSMKEEVTYRNDEATTLRWDNIYTSLESEYQKNKGGVWIDIIVGNLSQFAQSGETVPANRIWDLKNQKVYDPIYRASMSEIGIKYMQDKFKAKFGLFPVIWGNNMLFPTSLDDGRIKMLIPTTIKPRPLDGFAQENAYAGYGTGGNSGDIFNWTNYEEWKKNLQSIMFMGEQKLAAVPLIMDGGKDNGTFAKLPAERKHKLFMYCYASYLMAVKVEKDNSIYTKLGLTPIVDDNGKISLQLDPCFTWDIGKPAETLGFQDFERYKIDNREVWVRKFENGIVLVNPTDKNEENIDLTAFGKAFSNPDTKLNFLNSISLPEHSGAILFYENITAIEPLTQIEVFPNPTSETIQVKNLPVGQYIADVFALNGSVLASYQYKVDASSPAVQVPLNNLQSGSYILQFRSVRNNKANIIKRFVKQ